MTVVFRRAAILLGLITLLLALAPGSVRLPVTADEPDVNEAIEQQSAMEEQLAEQRSQLDALRRQEAYLTNTLADLRGDLNSVGLQLDEALRKLRRVTEALEESRADLARYRERIAGLQADLEQVARDIDQARADLAVREDLLEEHLNAAYEQMQVSMLEILLSTDSFGEATGQLSYMLTISDEDRRLAEEIRDMRERLRIREQTLRDGRTTLRQLRDAEAERVATLAEQQARVDAARRELRAHQRRLEHLHHEHRAHLQATERNANATRHVIEEQQRTLRGQRRLVERLKARAERLEIAYRGRFAWPEKGDFLVTQEFGRTSFDRNHTGIDMAYHSPVCSGRIYAAADGTILADGRPSAGYGDSAIGVIVGHSQRLQTWYWHLSREVVRVGQEVRTGDLLGYEGDTGKSTGCHLHFEVLLDGEPVNPREYLP